MDQPAGERAVFEEEAFQLALRESPNDPLVWSVFADWLEERGDPRAEQVRSRAATIREAQRKAEEMARERQVVAQQRVRYVRLKRQGIGGVVVAAAGLFLAVSFGMWALAERIHSELHGVYLIRPGVGEWFLFTGLIALFAALVLSPSIIRVLARWFGLAHVADPDLSPDRWRGMQFLRVAGGLFALFWCGIIVIRLDTWTVFGEDGMTINRQSSLGRIEEYRYADVVGIYFIREVSGSKEELNYLIRFADGATWSTSDGSRAAHPATNDEVMAFVSRKTGVPVQTVKALGDVPHQ
jgi:uncharacterized protein (TIGR02996 family)